MIALDIEASGVEQARHSIVALGALDTDNPANRLYLECRVWDGAHIDREALAISGMTEEEAHDPKKMSEAELITEFLAWSEHISNRTFLAQNVSFDRDYVAAALKRAGLDNPFAHRTLDVHSLAWLRMTLRGNIPPVDAEHHHSALNLDAALQYVGIPAEPEPHNALTGALCHAEVFSRVAYTKKLLPEFDHYDIPWLTT